MRCSERILLRMLHAAFCMPLHAAILRNALYVFHLHHPSRHLPHGLSFCPEAYKGRLKVAQSLIRTSSDFSRAYHAQLVDNQ